jgi:hypothetical protein
MVTPTCPPPPPTSSGSNPDPSHHLGFDRRPEEVHCTEFFAHLCIVEKNEFSHYLHRFTEYSEKIYMYLTVGLNKMR